MASIVRALRRLVSSNKGPEPRIRSDEEDATATDWVPASSALPRSSIPTLTHRVTEGDALTHFRTMLGITAAPHLGFSESTARPADNVGLYARVVHSEQRAKGNYKIFSGVINASYFLQIIVAAALTALGAAGADSKAVTAFGAINTVIAGFLTYLKGSGYPERFKHCAGEWKKVREFIEHRERDFSLEGHTLDVYDVVDAVREMYDKTKREIDMNNPDGHNAQAGMRLGHVDTSKAEAIAAKLHGLDDTVRKLRTRMSSVPGGVELKADDVAGKLRGLDETVETLRNRVSDEAQAKSDDVMTALRSLESTLEMVKTRVEKTMRQGHDTAHKAAHVATQVATHAIEDGRRGVAAELRGLGKAVISGVEEHKPHLPHDVSITVSHHDGGFGPPPLNEK